MGENYTNYNSIHSSLQSKLKNLSHVLDKSTKLLFPNYTFKYSRIHLFSILFQTNPEQHTKLPDLKSIIQSAQSIIKFIIHNFIIKQNKHLQRYHIFFLFVLGLHFILPLVDLFGN